MKKLVAKLTLAAMSVAVLGACQPKTTLKDFNKINGDQKAEAAESLLYSNGFMHADHQFDEALRLNPNNRLAQFYKASLGPLMLTRGILTRISGLVPQLQDANQAQYMKFKSEIPAGDLTTFLLDGKADLNSEKDVQQYFRTIQDSLRQARQVYFSLANSKEHLTLHVSTPKSGFTYSDVANKCKVTRLAVNTYSVQSCDVKDSRTFVLSYADFEALRLEAAVGIIFFSAGTAYDLTGLIDVLNTLHPSQHKHISDARIAAAVAKESQLGKLVDAEALKEVLGFGAEGVEATKIAVARQRELCPTGIRNPNNRPGKLFADGFCTDGSTPSVLTLLESGLRGAVMVPMGSSPQAYQTAIDATKPLNGSIVDLKSQLPATFDACGNATSIPDNSLGGLFVNNDATQAIRHGDPTFLNKVCR